MATRLRQRRGYMLSFAGYWATCTGLALWLLGGQRAVGLLGSRTPLPTPRPLAWAALIVSPLGAAAIELKPHFRSATAAEDAAAIGLAGVNATAEELFWRGLPAAAFQDDPICGWLFPAAGFTAGSTPTRPGRGEGEGAVTFSGAARGLGRGRAVDEMARDLAARIRWLGNALHATGAGAARPMSAQQLCEVVRTAYDPAAARVFDGARSRARSRKCAGATWGPTAAQVGWDVYRHDGALSVTWSMTQAPRGEVSSGVLHRLLRPHGDVDRKRVTLLYRPIDSARAARIVEQDKRNADFRVNSAARPSARALVEQRAAAATAAEEARGAGLVNFGMLVTATVTSPERLEAARQAIDHLAPTARIMLRPVYGSQDSAFAAALPLGLVLPSHLRVPAELRESL